MLAGRGWRRKPTRHFSSRRRPRLTDPGVRGRSRRRPWGKPTHRRRLPLVHGEGQPAVRGHSARRRLWLPPARRPPPLSGQASRLWSRQPAVAVFDQTVTKVFLSIVLCVFSLLPWPPELPAPPGPPSVCSALEAPSCVCLCVGPEGSPECPPPSLVVLLRHGTCLPGGGSYVRPLSCVSCVPASCFLIWLVSCPRFMSLLVNSVPGVCV